MKKLKFPLFLFAAASLALYSFQSGKADAGKEKEDFTIGSAAPLTNVEMADVDNTMHTLSKSKKENGLLVVFSCNTCPFVLGSDAFPGWERTYNDLHKTASDAGIGMVLVNSNEAKRGDDDSHEKMKEHAKDRGYTMPYLLDKNSELANAFGAKTTPHVFLLDKDMKLIYQGSIDNTWDPSRKEDIPYLTNAISNVKKGENVKENTTPPRGCSIKRIGGK